MYLRVNDHPILGPDKRKEKVRILVDGEEIEAYAGEPVAVALLASGKKVLRRTSKNREPRGIFCAIGLCTDCVMTLNGKANIRTCITPVQANMVVQTQEGSGRWRDDKPDE